MEQLLPPKAYVPPVAYVKSFLSNNCRRQTKQAGMNCQTRDANGLAHLLIGITTSTAIAASNLLRLSKGIALRMWRSSDSETMFMNKPVNTIAGGGLVPHAVGANQKWHGSTRQLMISSLKQLSWYWPPNRRQKSHLS